MFLLCVYLTVSGILAGGYCKEGGETSEGEGGVPEGCPARKGEGETKV